MFRNMFGLTGVLVSAVLIARCSPATLIPLVETSSCSGSGYRMQVNVWSFQLLPHVLQQEAVVLMNVAGTRNTRNGIDPDGYKGDAFSRTLGARLRRQVKTRAPVNVNISVFYRDLPTSRVVEELMSLNVRGGTGSITLPDDPRRWIIEAVWPDETEFLSPIKSGGKRRLWLFPEEWGTHCTMNIHGLVP